MPRIARLLTSLWSLKIASRSVLPALVNTNSVTSPSPRFTSHPSWTKPFRISSNWSASMKVFTTMKTFIDADQLDEILNGFVQEGWLVKRGDGEVTELVLTNAGKTEREAIFKLQSEVRRRAMRGISDQEYTTVIDVLQRMVNNLE